MSETTDAPETDSTDAQTDGDADGQEWLAAPESDERPPERGETVAHTLTLDMDRLGIYREMAHRGGDETLVLLAAQRDAYAVFAVDLAPDGEPLAFEPIGGADEEARAASMAEFWTQQNPDGVLGGEEPGLLAKLGGMLGAE